MQHVEVEQESNQVEQLELDAHIATFEFQYDETRSLKKSYIFSKCVLLLYHITSIVGSIPRIEINKLFISYCIALIGISISTCNLVRYEYAFYKNYGRIFRSFEEFKFWKLNSCRS